MRLLIIATIMFSVSNSFVRNVYRAKNGLKPTAILLRQQLSMSSLQDAQPVIDDIRDVGDRIRDLKNNKATKEEIAPVVEELLNLKKKYEEITGNPFDPPKKVKKEKSSTKPKVDNSNKKDSDFITPRSEDYNQWYNDIIYAADMVDQSPVRGCMVIKPWGMGVWDLLKNELDIRIRESGASNAYFPIFIPKSFLSKEAEHVDGFAKECAVVTHHRLTTSKDKNGKTELIPDPDAKLEEPLIVRPTSETVIWDMFGKWISSHRDLPLKINQWANVVRWELRTRPFLRSAEFLWQEGHTAHASSECAIGCAEEMLGMYSDVCKDMLAMPTVQGLKSPSERFAGADATYTIEAIMQNGWALQSGTSHYLGQNFARAFDVQFQSADKNRELVWATSWGVSTRLLGALIMTHSDDKGLVLPPPVAPTQIVVVPIPDTKNTLNTPEGQDGVLLKAEEIVKELKSKGIRVKLDDRDQMRPGAKYFEWERKGVPMRIEIGPRDIAQGNVMTVMRDVSEKKPIQIGDLSKHITSSLSDMHTRLYQAAQKRLKDNTFTPSTYEEMKSMIIAANEGEMADRDNSKSGFYLVPWKCDADNEDAIKEDCKATIRCYPLEHNKAPPSDGIKCFYSGEQATHMAIFARAY